MGIRVYSYPKLWDFWYIPMSSAVVVEGFRLKMDAGGTLNPKP